MTSKLSRQIIAKHCNLTPGRARFWKGKRVLVTGATGMLGSWMTHTLVEAGAVVTIIQRDLAEGSLLLEDDTYSRLNIVQGSFTDYEMVERVMFDYEPEFVFHLGAQTQVRTANRQPWATFEANVKGTFNILEGARKSPFIKGVLIASSDKAYGAQPELPYTEEAPLQGRYPYDCSKSCVDLISRSYYETFDLPVCITRCGNLYGPGDKNFDRIIPGTVRSVFLGETPIIRSDGKFVRDYFFVPDAVDGYLTIAEHIHNGDVVGQAFNLSTMNKVNVLELFKMIIKTIGVDVEPKVLNQASNEIREQFLSSEKAEKILKWKPQHTLEEGLRITVDWYRQYFNVKEQGLDGIQVKEFEDIESEQGSIQHMLRSDSEMFGQFGEIYFSTTKPDAVKGWHLHDEQTSVLSCISGLMELQLHDMRGSSPTYGNRYSIIFGDNHRKLVKIPPGVAYAWRNTGETPAILANCATHPHDPEKSRKISFAELPFDEV